MSKPNPYERCPKCGVPHPDYESCRVEENYPYDTEDERKGKN